MQDLTKLLKILLENDIDFVLIGGFAAVIHGSTIVTQDIDICMSISDESVNKLRTALREINPWHRMNRNARLSFLEHPTITDGVNNIYLQTDLGILDILSETRPAGPFEEIKKRSIEIPLYGFKCRVISVDDLILVKEALQRPKDIQAIQELKKVKEKLKL